MDESRTIRSTKTQIGDWVFVIICVLISLICVIPMINLLARSLSGTDYLVRHEVYLIPKGFNFDAYKTVLGDVKYIHAFVWTVFLTVVCTVFSLFMTTICAYPLIFENLKGRGIINIFITITMFFSAGTIPNYLLMQKIGFLDNPLVLIVPYCMSVYNMIIMRQFFEGIPNDLRESAFIDGCNDVQIMFKIILPLSKAIILTIALYYGVQFWNDYMRSLLYLQKSSLKPLPLLLRDILLGASMNDNLEANAFGTAPIEAIKAASVFISAIPMIIAYPFIQKYFTKGTLAGSVKG